MDRRTFLNLGAAGLLLAALRPAAAEVNAGHDYLELPEPFAPETGAQIEVRQFFWYGCPHCYRLEPALNAWLKTLPAEAAFRRSPAIFSESWKPGAQLYFTLEQLDLLPQLHQAVFEAIHEHKIDLRQDEILLDWIAARGVDRATFAQAYRSPAIAARVAAAVNRTGQARIDGVPALIIDGRFLITPSLSSSQQAMLSTADELIVLARQKRALRPA